MRQILDSVYPIIVTVAMAGILVWYLARYFYEAWTGRSLGRHIDLSIPAERPKSYNHSRALRAFIYVLILYAVSRLLAYAATEVVAYIEGYGPTTPENFLSRWNHWDTVNYLRIAENWYGFDNTEQTLTIVFLPGYALMIKALWFVVRDYALAGYIISNVLFIGSGCLLYAIVADKYDEHTARRADFLLYFAPFTAVFSVTHSESAFLFFTLLTLYFARKRRFALAILAGIYCTFIRQFGMFVAIPLFYEMLCATREKLGTEPELNGRRAGRAVLSFAACCLILIGYGAYMFINWKVYGNPLQFLEFQRTNWGNEIAPIWVTVRTNLREIFTSDRDSWKIGVWGAQLFLMAAIPALMIKNARRGDAGDNAYAWAYAALTFSSTWLISGVRYLTAMYPLYIMLALITAKPAMKYIVFGISIILMLLGSPYYALMAGVI